MGSSVSSLSGMALSANCSLPVLQVLFREHSSEGAEWMISSSADGLISVMDLRDGLDEDNAFRVSSLSSIPMPRSQSKIVSKVMLLKNAFERGILLSCMSQHCQDGTEPNLAAPCCAGSLP